MKVCTVVGTRPNFMKAAPLIEEFRKQGITHKAVISFSAREPVKRNCQLAHWSFFLGF